MTHLRLQVWGKRGLAIYQTANITVNFYDIFCNAYISACIRAKNCGKYFGNLSAAQILLKIFTEIFAVHNFFCKKMRKKTRKFQRCKKNFANIYGIFCGAQNFLQKNAGKNTETISNSYMIETIRKALKVDLWCVRNHGGRDLTSCLKLKQVLS